MAEHRRLIVQGHRGCRGDLPENTLVGLRHALDLGVDMVEIDVNASADDQLLVVHDETTNTDLVRVADGHWTEDRIPWRALPWETIRGFDVGRLRPDSEYARRFAEQRAVDGARVPCLQEVIDLLQEYPAARINIEIKCDPHAPEPRAEPRWLADRVMQVVYATGMAERVTVQSFNWRAVEAVVAAGELVTGCLSSEQAGFDTIGRHQPGGSPWTAGRRVADFDGSVAEMVKSIGVHYWSSDYRDLDQDRVHEGRRLGLGVHCWTVNRVEDMRRLASWSIDSIISDYPRALLAAVGRG